MYDAVPDPYCYPGTTILKNLADLRDAAELAEFETAMTTIRADEPLPPGALDYLHYCAIHRHLFQDVFEWAGEIRTVRLSKRGNAFCFPEYIDAQMRRLFADLAARDYVADLAAGAFAGEAAHFLAELNAIHPFREGNGRTQLAFLLLLAERAGHPILLADFDEHEMLAAMIESFSGRETPLSDLIYRLIDNA